MYDAVTAIATALTDAQDKKTTGVIPSTRPTQAPAGTNAYWVARREGFALLRRFKLDLQKAHCSHQYVQGAWNTRNEEYEIDENVQPWNDAGDSLDKVMAHACALSILRAHGIDRARLNNWDKHLLSRLP